MRVDDIKTLRNAIELSVTAIGETLNPGCIDLLGEVGTPFGSSTIGRLRVLAFAEAATTKGHASMACRDGCLDLDRPFCQAGSCVGTTCTDAAQVRACMRVHMVASCMHLFALFSTATNVLQLARQPGCSAPKLAVRTSTHTHVHVCHGMIPMCAQGATTYSAR